MGFKRYIKNCYPIAGVRWTDGGDTNGEFGILLSQQKITTDTQRRTIADEQVLINLDNFRITIRAEANTASNIGPGAGLYAQKVEEDLQFKSIVAGAGINIQEVGDSITISQAAFVATILTNLETFQLPPSGAKGEMIFDTTIDKARVWNGTQWKILSFE
jgi:hypothetical protein